MSKDDIQMTSVAAGGAKEEQGLDDLVGDIERAMNDKAFKVLWEAVFATLDVLPEEDLRIRGEIVKSIRRNIMSCAMARVKDESEERKKKTRDFFDDAIESAAEKFLGEYSLPETTQEFRDRLRREFKRNGETP